jgi:phosphate transport system protein
MDNTMDDLSKSLFRHILSWGASDEGSIQQAVQLALVARHYERVADHAVTIAERVQFMVTGLHPGAEPTDEVFA